MKNVTVDPEEFAKAVMMALDQYKDEAEENIKKTTKSVVRRAISELKGTEPTGGSYARGWSHKASKGRVGMVAGETIYNRTDYQLTHLLEKPHTTGPHGGGHYPKKKDYTGNLARVEEKYTQEYFEEVKSKL